MTYIFAKDKTINLDGYFKYLESIRGQLPSHVYDFAAQANHYNLHSHSSLHDAWLESMTISEPARGDRNQNRRVDIELCLLGPFHDRKMHLYYKDVYEYSFDTATRRDKLPSVSGGHGDLLSHEIRLDPPDIIIHELQFSRGGVFLIKCREFSHREELIA